MFPSAVRAANPDEKKSELFEVGSVLRIRFPGLKGLGLTKVGLHSAIMHFGNPSFVDVTNVKQKE